MYRGANGQLVRSQQMPQGTPTRNQVPPWAQNGRMPGPQMGPPMKGPQMGPPLKAGPGVRQPPMAGIQPVPNSQGRMPQPQDQVHIQPYPASNGAMPQPQGWNGGVAQHMQQGGNWDAGVMQNMQQGGSPWENALQQAQPWGPAQFSGYAPAPLQGGMGPDYYAQAAMMMQNAPRGPRPTPVPPEQLAGMLSAPPQKR
jgi:hypothetical protein